MNKIIVLLALVSSLMVWQACSTKESKNSQEEQIGSEPKVEVEDRATKRARLVRANAEKADQRKLATELKAKSALTYVDAAGKIVYNKAEVNPSFIGGDEAMNKYLSENIKYPEDALTKGVEGTVFVDFIVDEKGQVREVTATDFVGEEVDLLLKQEALRVVSSMPQWAPGTQHGKPVDASFSVPITFEIN